MPRTGLGRIAIRRVGCREDLRLQQFPEAVVWEVFAHVRRRGQQEDIRATPRELAIRPGCPGSDDCLGQPVPVGATDRKVRLPVGRELVGLIEDDEDIWLDIFLLKATEHSISGEGVNAHDREVAVRSHERVVRPGVSPGDDLE